MDVALCGRQLPQQAHWQDEGRSGRKEVPRLHPEAEGRLAGAPREEAQAARHGGARQGGLQAGLTRPSPSGSGAPTETGSAAHPRKGTSSLHPISLVPDWPHPFVIGELKKVTQPSKTVQAQPPLLVWPILEHAGSVGALALPQPTCATEDDIQGAHRTSRAVFLSSGHLKVGGLQLLELPSQP